VTFISKSPLVLKSKFIFCGVIFCSGESIGFD
jgi:hypothetical protein